MVENSSITFSKIELVLDLCVGEQGSEVLSASWSVFPVSKASKRMFLFSKREGPDLAVGVVDTLAYDSSFRTRVHRHILVFKPSDVISGD